MSRLKNYLLPVAACMIFVSILIVTNIGNAAPPDKDVNVINTPNVNVVNSPTVHLAPGGSVGIAGTPNVAVGNTEANPVPIRDVDNPARQPFQTVGGGQLPALTCGSSFTFAVPANKRLVIEFASANVRIQAIGQIAEVGIQTTVGLNLSGPYRVPLNRTGTVGSEERFEGSQQMRVYHDTGTVFVGFGRTIPCAGIADFSVSISGYLVDLP